MSSSSSSSNSSNTSKNLVPYSSYSSFSPYTNLNEPPTSTNSSSPSPATQTAKQVGPLAGSILSSSTSSLITSSSSSSISTRTSPGPFAPMHEIRHSTLSKLLPPSTPLSSSLSSGSASSSFTVEKASSSFFSTIGPRKFPKCSTGDLIFFRFDLLDYDAGFGVISKIETVKEKESSYEVLTIDTYAEDGQPKKVEIPLKPVKDSTGKEKTPSITHIETEQQDLVKTGLKQNKTLLDLEESGFNPLSLLSNESEALRKYIEAKSASPNQPSQNPNKPSTPLPPAQKQNLQMPPPPPRAPAKLPSAPPQNVSQPQLTTTTTIPTTSSSSSPAAAIPPRVIIDLVNDSPTPVNINLAANVVPPRSINSGRDLQGSTRFSNGVFLHPNCVDLPRQKPKDPQGAIRRKQLQENRRKFDLIRYPTGEQFPNNPVFYEEEETQHGFYEDPATKEMRNEVRTIKKTCLGFLSVDANSGNTVLYKFSEGHGSAPNGGSTQVLRFQIVPNPTEKISQPAAYFHTSLFRSNLADFLNAGGQDGNPRQMLDCHILNGGDVSDQELFGFYPEKNGQNPTIPDPVSNFFLSEKAESQRARIVETANQREKLKKAKYHQELNQRDHKEVENLLTTLAKKQELTDEETIFLLVVAEAKQNATLAPEERAKLSAERKALIQAAAEAERNTTLSAKQVANLIREEIAFLEEVAKAKASLGDNRLAAILRFKYQQNLYLQVAHPTAFADNRAATTLPTSNPAFSSSIFAPYRQQQPAPPTAPPPAARRKPRAPRGRAPLPLPLPLQTTFQAPTPLSMIEAQLRARGGVSEPQPLPQSAPPLNVAQPDSPFALAAASLPSSSY